ncbi:MAG: hypothetical protein KatS3mg031_2396 [Chitinophagales bacterium]|nr:MAG: hypothetical protein KatS3mg031_2396 [Chitinophagales bacterium]
MSLIGKEFQLSIPSDANSIAEVESFVDQLRGEFEIPDELYGNILICLTEAVNNCIMHGNKYDPSKTVKVSGTKDGAVIIITAADEGEGFDYENLPDPTAPENLHKSTGRGVFLMKQLSDYLKYSNGGATVEMRFKILS